MIIAKSVSQNLVLGSITQGDTLFFNNNGLIPIETIKGGISEELLSQIPISYLSNYHTIDTPLPNAMFFYISFDEEYLRLIKNKNMGFDFRHNVFSC